MLKAIRSPPDVLEEYKAEFGYLGPALCTAVIKARQTPTTTTSSNPPPSLKPTLSISQVRPLSPPPPPPQKKEGGGDLKPSPSISSISHYVKLMSISFSFLFSLIRPKVFKLSEVFQYLSGGDPTSSATAASPTGPVRQFRHRQIKAYFFTRNIQCIKFLLFELFLFY